jgi:hypothetical protein
MTRSARPWRAENWADFLPSMLGYSSPPVDLYAVARHRRINHVGLRFIIPRGLLLPVDGGFKVYLRDSKRRDIDVLQPEATDGLSVRQRFALAHEIAHTLFYRFSGSVPTPEEMSSDLELEKICDRTAGHILIPTNLLKKEIGDYRRIDAHLIRSLAFKFRTSLTVAIERLATVEPSNPFERGIVLLRRVNGDAQIRAMYFGIGLLRTIPRPVRYSRLTEWISEVPRSFIGQNAESEWRTTRMGRTVAFEKMELGSGQDFLLQVEVPLQANA